VAARHATLITCRCSSQLMREELASHLKNTERVSVEPNMGGSRCSMLFQCFAETNGKTMPVITRDPINITLFVCK